MGLLFRPAPCCELRGSSRDSASPAEAGTARPVYGEGRAASSLAPREAGLLFQVLERFKNVDLHPDKIDNPTMGTIFEELIRKFNENPGEHFTPRDVVHLMVDLMLAGDEDRIRRKGVVCTVYDPCCGSGGMLMITKEHITVGVRKNGEILRPPINPGAEIHLFGQEVNPETWAVSKSDLFIKDPTGRDADNTAFGSVLSDDSHERRRFDYLITNPPYGKDWKRDEDAVRAEHERGRPLRAGLASDPRRPTSVPLAYAGAHEAAV